MPFSARAGDLWIGRCCHPDHSGCESMGGFIVTGSVNTISTGKGQAAVTDLTIGWCGHPGFIITGSPNALVNNKGKAVTGSRVSGNNRGIVITGNPTHNVN